MKKICFITYPMAFHTIGGGEIQLLEYKSYLDKLVNYNVDLFNPWEPKFEEYDIFHFFSCMAGSYPLCEFIKKMNKKLVISSSLWITEQNKKLLPTHEIKYQLELSDVIITNSKQEIDNLSEHLDIKKNKFNYVYNGSNSEIFSSNNSLKKNSKEKYILNVANIESRKNQLALAKAIEKVDKNLKLYIAGHIRDFNYFNELKKFKNVKYLGYVEHSQELVSLINNSELLALPSFLETPGLSALEAYALNKKILITKEGSTKEYFNDEVTYVDPYDINSIAKGISLILIDKTPKYISNYSWNVVLKKLTEIYDQL